MLRREENKIVLCCNGKACPQLSVDSTGNVVIEDDFGQQITITKEQANLIPEAIQELE
jgi:hypothetical protein